MRKELYTVEIINPIMDDPFWKICVDSNYRFNFYRLTEPQLQYECSICKNKFKNLKKLQLHIRKYIKKHLVSQGIFPTSDERHLRQVREGQHQSALAYGSSVLKQFPSLTKYVEKTENSTIGKNKKETTLRKPDWRKDICDDTHYD